jgi:hypothetical protein
MAPRSWHGFDEGLSAWGKSLLQTPKLLANRAFYIRDPAEQIADKAAAGQFDNYIHVCNISSADHHDHAWIYPSICTHTGVQMKQCLNWFHVMMLGTGEIEDGTNIQNSILDINEGG